ncbi:MAG: hypothetical protein JNN01_15620 [Opitutaceae bacterium]|nr:hypothetical protein [Opitutaceae bacterium]
MYLLLTKLVAWLVEKLGVAVLIVVLALGAYALWLFVRDQQGADQQRIESLARLVRERDALLELKAQIATRLQGLKADLAVQQERIERAERVLNALKELESWWDRLFGNTEQQKANREQAARVERLKAEAVGRLPELERLLTHTSWELEGAQGSLARLESEMERVRKTQSMVAHYVRAAWDRSKGYIALALGLYLFGPSVWKVFLFYVIAPLVGRGRPLRLSDVTAAIPAVGASHVSVDVPLWPGEVLRVKEKFLQASDEGLGRRTRFLLDWKIPFTSLACGLAELVEMKNGTAGAEYRVTLSNADDPHMELSVVQIPAGSSLILRPRFLAGVVTPLEEPLRIARRWVLGRWLSWVTLQFRFFEFKGPCRLVVAGTRGIRAENLADREGQARAARRTNQDATIGFTPSLEYLPVRAETFWGFYRDMNPLFDDLFVGPGLFLCQETSVPGEGGKPGRVWSAVWNGVLKVFGL